MRYIARQFNPFCWCVWDNQKETWINEGTYPRGFNRTNARLAAKILETGGSIDEGDLLAAVEAAEEPAKPSGKKRGRPPRQRAEERDPPPIDVGDDKLLARLREFHPGRDLEEDE